MMHNLDRLQSIFTGFLQKQPRLPAFAPAFFVDELLTTVEEMGFNPVQEVQPFGEYWMIYESSNGSFGTVSNIALVRDGELRLWGITHGAPGALRHFCTFRLDNPRDYEIAPTSLPRAVQETLPEVRIILDRIAHHERSEATPEVLRRANKDRNKANVKKIAPYIVVGASRKPSPPAVAIGNGTAKPPHERRGHMRTLASGRQVPIKACSIHGGSPVARDYRVTA